MKPLVEASQERSASSDYNRVVQSLPDVYVTLLDRVDDHLVHARPLKAYLIWREEYLWCFELLGAKLNDLTIRQVIVRRVLVLVLLVVVDVEAYWN